MKELSESSRFYNPKMKMKTMDAGERMRMKEEQDLMKMQILKARKAVKVLTGVEAEKVYIYKYICILRYLIFCLLYLIYFKY